VDIKLYAELIRIEKALVEKQSVTEALAWCGENRGTLKKTKVSICEVQCGYQLRKIEQSRIYTSITRLHRAV
jgi:hypothetical protein